MYEYETTYIIDNTVAEEAVPELIDKYSKYLVDTGAQVDNINKWGMRKFAFEIDGKREGYYVTMRFHSHPDAAKELGRMLRLADEVVRSVIFRYN